MDISVLANEVTKQEFISKINEAGIEIKFIEDVITNFTDLPDAFFILRENIPLDPAVFCGKPVFINMVTDTLSEKNLPGNFFRINGWPGFLNREFWEVAGINTAGCAILQKLQCKFIPVSDEPGLVAARIISMVINEAYFALGEGVSSKSEIDVAMKLGTNYPLGPFEWSEKIGLTKIHNLLEKLGRKEPRYTIAPVMLQEISNKI